MRRLASSFRRYLAQTSAAPMGVEIVSARGCWVKDREGRRYLDLLGGMGVANIGHRHAEVVRAVRDQAGRYLHAMVYGEYIQEPQITLARALARRLPAELSTVYFTNSGTEAIEGALKTGRKHTGRNGIVAFEGSFHGDTFGALSIGGNPVYRKPFGSLLPGVRFLPYGEAGALDAIDAGTAVVVIEPVQAEGGVRIPPPGFLCALRRRCSDAGALLIYDEVVTGFGRTGHLFAFEASGVVPDLLVLAKALGGGMPLGAFVASPEILACLADDPPLGHVTTFGGHPVSCAAGLAALSVLRRGRLASRAARVGKRFREDLARLPWDGILHEIRGVGLLIGIELVGPEATERFTRGCFSEGLILSWTLHRDRVVRLAPPLTISDREITFALRAMKRVLDRG